MSDITIGTTTYVNPEQGQSPPHGEQLHDLLDAIVTTINSVSGSNDIPLTSATIENDQSSTPLIGASFDSSTVRSFILTYSVSRMTSDSESNEVGTLYGVYNGTANSWDMSQTFGGDAEIDFSISGSGNISYSTSDITGTDYLGSIKFSARSFLQ